MTEPMSADIRAIFEELRRFALGGGTADPAAVSRIRNLIDQLLTSPAVTEGAREKLWDALNWFEVLYSNDRHRRWIGPLNDGAMIVRSFLNGDLMMAERELLRTPTPKRSLD